MLPPIILAHGALGNFDEIIFLGIGVIFLGMMGLSWLRSRGMPVEDQVEDEAQSVNTTPPESPDRFRLD